MERTDMYPLHSKVSINGHPGVIYEMNPEGFGWYGVYLDRVVWIGGLATIVLHGTHSELTLAPQTALKE